MDELLVKAYSFERKFFQNCIIFVIDLEYTLWFIIKKGDENEIYN